MILTHDAATMAGFAYDRIRAARPMPGIIEVKLGGEIRRAVDDVLTIILLAREDEIVDRVIFVPF